MSPISSTGSAEARSRIRSQDPRSAIPSSISSTTASTLGSSARSARGVKAGISRLRTRVW